MKMTSGARAVTGLFLFALVFGPLAFGSVEQWSLSVVEITCVSAFAIYSCLLHMNRNAWREVPGLLPLLLLLGVMAFQLIPLPQALLSALSPQSFNVYRDTLGNVSDGFWAPVSLDRRATFMELTRYASYVCFYVVGIQLMSRKDQLKFFGRFVVFVAASIAFISILHKFSAGELILWVREAPPGSKFFGPFVNKNHFAAYMGMVFPLGAGLFLAYRPDVSGLGLMDALKATAGHKRIHMYFIFGFASLFIASSLFVSLSRAGVISLCISMVFMAILLGRRDPGRNFGMGILFLLVAVLVGWFGWTPIIERFGAVVDEEGALQFDRILIWADSINAIRDFPAFGAGFGAFGSVYPAYRSMPGSLVVDHAHNDYIELLVEGGIVSFALVAWFVISVITRVIRTLWIRRERYSITMGIAGAAAIIYMLVHAFVDFNMHIGANALYFFFAASFAVSASHTRLRKGRKSSLLKELVPKYRKTVLYVLVAASAGVVLANMTVLAGALAVRGLNKDTPAREMPSAEMDNYRDRYSLASLLDPLNAGYRAALARAEMSSGNSGLDEYTRAIGLLPTDARILRNAAGTLWREGDSNAADALMSASSLYGARRHDIYLHYAEWLLYRGRYKDVESVTRKGISLEPRRTVEYARMMSDMGLSGPEILGAIADMAVPHIILAGYFKEQGDEFLADDTYWRALDLMDGNNTLRGNDYRALLRHFFGRGRFDAALAVALGAAEKYPNAFWCRAWLGNVYEKKGEVKMAIEEFEKALLLKPGHRNIRRRLERLYLLQPPSGVK